jgi:hypothetical protein
MTAGDHVRHTHESINIILVSLAKNEMYHFITASALANTEGQPSECLNGNARLKHRRVRAGNNHLFPAQVCA